MYKTAIILGSTLAFLAVAIGAFGAHGLQATLTANDRVDTFETAVKYHIYHALALILVGVLLKLHPDKQLTYSIWLFTIGILIFSGSLYTLSLTGIRMLGAITPIGGLCLLLAWAMLAYNFIKG